jgi:AcrR family transcriptional regulator
MQAEVRVDARVVQSRNLLIEAMVQLIKQRPSSEIPISELCKAAGVSRPTFYQHFRSPDDVLAAAMENKLARLRAAAETPGLDPDEVPAFIGRFLQMFWTDRHLYRTLLDEDSPYSRTRRVTEDWMAEKITAYFYPDIAPTELAGVALRRVNFVSGGIITTLGAWLEDENGGHSDLPWLGTLLWDNVLAVIHTNEPHLT